jgi:hypothetical protein
VGAHPNFREIQRGRGNVRVPSIGVPISKIIKLKIIMKKFPTITIHRMQIHHCAIEMGDVGKCLPRHPCPRSVGNVEGVSL